MLIVYCLHGDELQTEKIAKKLKENFNDIDTIIGNPEARKAQKRFIETDLNRSFNLQEETLESKRAKKLQDLIAQTNHELLIDLHTTKAKMPPVAIITDLDQLKLVSRVGISRVIYMTPKFSSGGSLIENVKNAFSIEFYRDQKSEELVYDKLRQAYKKKRKIDKFEVYFLEEIVNGDYDPSIKNFQRLPDGSYPIFSGETSYENVKYLKTRKKIIKLSELKAM